MSKAITTAAEAEREADRLRRDLTGTLDQLLDNLAPQHLASEAFAASRLRLARARAPRWLKAYSAFAVGPVGLGLMGAAAAGLALGVLGPRRRR